MNKQDILNQIEWHLEETEGENASGTFDQGYKEGCYHCEALIEQLDEPKKVKVPAFVVSFIEKLKITNRRYGVELEKAYNNGEDEELVNWLWFNENVLTLFRALENGYEVEEEPKFVVKQKDGVYIEGLAMIEGKTYAKPFESEVEACKWAELCSGTVEKV